VLRVRGDLRKLPAAVRGVQALGAVDEVPGPPGARQAVPRGGLRHGAEGARPPERRAEGERNVVARHGARARHVQVRRAAAAADVGVGTETGRETVMSQMWGAVKG
jgi:hypothetical protein